MNDTKFAVNDYNGITVSCTVDRWDNHITIGYHTIMSNNVEAVKDTIKDPDIVYRSNQNSNRDVYFKASELATYKPLLTKVIIEFSQGKNNPNSIVGNVVTAFPQKDVKGGISDEVVYQRPTSN